MYKVKKVISHNVMYRLEVKLKQHTPLIHFQHAQEGATLRASEVKPKLDRFILERLGESADSVQTKIGENECKEKGENFAKLNNYKKGYFIAKGLGWLIGKGNKPALDYKMKITPTESLSFFLPNEKKKFTSFHAARKKEPIEETVGQKIVKFLGKERNSDKKLIHDLTKYPLFFANIDADINNDNEYKKLSFTDGLIKLIFHATQNDIISKIEESVCGFFMNHNFGMRQSKGFGSFYIDKSDKLYCYPQSNYKFNLDVTGNNEYAFKNLFSNIESFYNTLRAGINQKDFYFKSLLFMYCKDVLKAKWDKRIVKETFYPNHKANREDNLVKQRKKHSRIGKDEPLTIELEKEYDVRDLLGFSTNERWMSFGDSIEKKAAVKKDSSYGYPDPKDDLKADRMRSPILFKPLYGEIEEGKKGYTIHILFQDDKVWLEEFKSVRKICFYSKKRYGVERFMIDLPSEFSTENYFKYIFNTLNFDIEMHVEKKHHSHEYYDLLKDIYFQLKKHSE